MSLIFDNPEKYLELLDRLAQEEKEFTKNKFRPNKKCKRRSVTSRIKMDRFSFI